MPRPAVALALLLVAGLVVAPGSSRASVGDLSADELCELYPQDEDFIFQANPGNRSCFADRGDCDRPASETETCVSGIVIQATDAREALRMVKAPAGIYKVVPGLGEFSTGGCDDFSCEVSLQRDRFWASAMVASPLGLEAATELAAKVDARIIRLLAGASDEAVPEDPEQPQPAGPGGGAPDPQGPSDAVVDVFFGTEGIEALVPDIRRVLDCKGAAPEDGILDCQGADDGRKTAIMVLIQFAKDYEHPSQRQTDGIQAYADALVFAGMVARDGTALFPSIRSAMPLIRRLSNPAMVNRFVAMLAARDAEEWGERYP